MDLAGILNAPGDFPSSVVSGAVKAQAFQWLKEVTRAFDTIAPNHSLPISKAKRVPWFTEELRVRLQRGRQLEQCWWKTKVETNQIFSKAIIGLVQGQ